MTVAELKAQLALVQSKINEILKTGQSVSVSGAFSVENPQLSELRKQEQYLKEAILKRLGYKSRNVGKFN